MRNKFPARLRKPILAALILCILQLSCGGVSQTDPRVPAVLNSMVGVFSGIFGPLSAIPVGVTQPPIITQLTSNSVSGLANATVPSVKVRLYHIQLQGCGKEPQRGGLLGEAMVDNSGAWSVSYSAGLGEVVAATQIVNGEESGLSNLKVNQDADKFLAIINADEIEQGSQETHQPIVLKGTSFPGACVVLQNEDPMYGRVGSSSVGSGGQWQISARIHDGQNKFNVFIEGWQENGTEITLTGFTPKMQWPYTSKDSNGNYLSQVTTFFGYNDFYYQLRGKTFHDGIDISGEPYPSFVRAVADGNVFYVQVSNQDWSGGNVVIIDHGAWYSLYMHLSKISVQCPKPITADTIKNCNSPSASKYFDNAISVNGGDVIGVTGETGCPGCGVHLHFSAYRWMKGNRETSLGKVRTLTWPWYRNYGERLNVNPPADTTLQIGTFETYPAFTVNSTDRLGYCASGSNYWDVDWQLITIKEWDPPNGKMNATGTKFDNMGTDLQCAIEHNLTKPLK